MPSQRALGDGGTSRLARGLFVTAVVLLIALGVWWIVLLDRSLASEHRLMRQALSDAAAVHAAHLQASTVVPPIGAFADDPRFVVVDRLPAAADLGAIVRAPRRLLANEEATARLEQHYARKGRMLFGEGVLLCSLLLAVVAMLYRLFRAERRFRDEIEGFLSRVTHEMKTPLAGIKAVLQLIESGKMPPERLTELAGKALREVEREEALVQNLLLAQRLRIGAKLAAEDIDIAALANAIVDARADIGGDGGIAVRVVVDAATAVVASADETAVRSILDNLLDNALKYGGKTIELTISASDQHAVIVIGDDGIGFDQTKAEALFLPYVRVPAGAGGRRGTGLGLWIARGLAEGMGGALAADSVGAGQGARFTLRLPLAQRRSIA